MPIAENKYEWADNVRAIATVSVIFLHVSAPLLYLYGKVPGTYWWIGNIADGMVRFSVPLFVMLTGYLLIPKADCFIEFIQKRSSRILLPFLFWSIIYFGFKFIQLYYSEPQGLHNYLWSSLHKGTFYHLWYIYMLIGIYLFLPIISKWVLQAHDKELIIFIGIWFFTLIFNFPFLSKYKIDFNLIYFSGFIGYVLLGYYIPRIKLKNPMLVGGILYVIGTLITIMGTYFLTKKNGNYYPEFYKYLTPNVALASAGIYLIIKNYKNNNSIVKKIIGSISQYSYGIYLSHAIVLASIEEIGLYWNLIHPIIGIFLTTIFGIFLSWLITIILNKLPYGKYISG